MKTHYGEDPESYHLSAEIPNLEEKINQRQSYLFENVNPIIENSIARKIKQATFKNSSSVDMGTTQYSQMKV